jgi:peptide/nickel transport system substrate-binding protein
MAALLTGELDLVLDPPLQDVPRLRSDPRSASSRARESRDLLVMDQNRDELKYSR